MLSRRETIIRKLLIKYHDDASILKKEMSAVAYSFDPHLAERTRVKDPAAYSKEELAWSTVDRVLHPEVRRSHPPIPSIYPSIHVSIYPSIHPSIHLIHPSIHPCVSDVILIVVGIVYVEER